ncbi:MAG TPA: methyltransferase domain-containing protein [Desulfobacteraceae bacterium]|nr:methyltransferase domain-containing protein [Desulfobacteraceae bacterium]HPJ67653.1 methyltransferase domain-containing protein [Desulfobacteraceae bacterium]HPQ29377.1 methyltransferase domain-containing protein [Desulfobacteraceae bacterium]
MNKRLLEILICPRCLPDEIQLAEKITDIKGNDIINGELRCPGCGKIYFIENGIADLAPNPSDTGTQTDTKYETPSVVSSYIWSHFSDIMKEESASDAYLKWAGLIRPHSGMALDTGCAVGRFTFEISRLCDFVIGIDNSHAFIKTARELMINRKMNVSLKQEGCIHRNALLSLPETWNKEKTEFILGDAQMLPFKKNSFASFCSLNLVDKLSKPLSHLKEMNRITCRKDAQFLLSDPFSWSTDVAEIEDWLGGKIDGPLAGRGIDNIVHLLTDHLFCNSLPWKIESLGNVWWKIRTHENHFEQIKSCFIKASR